MKVNLALTSLFLAALFCREVHGTVGEHRYDGVGNEWVGIGIMSDDHQVCESLRILDEIAIWCQAKEAK